MTTHSVESRSDAIEIDAPFTRMSRDPRYGCAPPREAGRSRRPSRHLELRSTTATAMPRQPITKPVKSLATLITARTLALYRTWKLRDDEAIHGLARVVVASASSVDDLEPALTSAEADIRRDLGHLKAVQDRHLSEFFEELRAHALALAQAA
jgi:hypothetical protein